MKFNQHIFPLLIVFITGCLLTGCNKQSSEAAPTVSEMAEQIKASISFDYYPDTSVDAETLESLFGLTPDMYEDYFCEMPMISVQSDMLLIVKPTQNRQQEVLSALQNYLDYQQNEALQYPVNAIQIKATEIYEKDGYIYYIALFGDTTSAEENDTELLSLCEARTKEVISIIDEEP